MASFVRQLFVSAFAVSVLLNTEVASFADDAVPSFLEDVVPVLTRHGCNAGTCHGKLAGQNGFRLSLRGYAPELDFDSLTRESHGRRIHVAAPRQSLLIRKATGLVPHGGGTRIAPDSRAEEVLLKWIAAGAPGPREDETRVERLEVQPPAATLSLGMTQPLTVTAIYEDASRRDVTWLAQFAAGDAALLEVQDDHVTALRPGETVVRATFQGHVEIATFTMPFENDTEPAWYAQRNNEIDRHIFEKLASLRIEPSPLCDDATFIRRAYLDAIGVLPTPQEVPAFLADDAPDKRERLIDRLLQRPEFVDYWAHWLGDLLQNRQERDHDVRGTKGVRAMHAWLREQVAAGRSWRDIATDVLLAQGPCDENPQVGYYIVTVGEKPAEQSDVADSVAQAFLGTRIGCARCHNHPLEKYTQDDYYHFAAFFTRVALDRRKPEEGPTQLVIATRHMLNLERQLEQQQVKLPKLKANAADAKEIENAGKRIADIQAQLEAARQAPVETQQPRTGEGLSPQSLDRSPVSIAPGQDPREPLVRWMTDPANEQFSGAMVNRLWKHFLGVGLVEPVDDLRATNPPSNQALWDLLNREFVAGGYDLKRLMRLIMKSRTYQLAAETRETNARDDRHHSHFHARRLPAEVLLDAISQATGVPQQFAGYPLGMRAMQIPDPGVDSRFLTLFGRSERTTACACERSEDVTLPQVLHMHNGDTLLAKLTAPEGFLAKLLSKFPDSNDNVKAVEELFLQALSRLPNPAERTLVLSLLEQGDRREVLLDAMWALLNSKEFAFNH